MTLVLVVLVEAVLAHQEPERLTERLIQVVAAVVEETLTVAQAALVS
jgi:hypothetical protein